MKYIEVKQAWFDHTTGKLTEREKEIISPFFKQVLNESYFLIVLPALILKGYESIAVGDLSRSDYHKCVIEQDPNKNHVFSRIVREDNEISENGKMYLGVIKGMTEVDPKTTQEEIYNTFTKLALMVEEFSLLYFIPSTYVLRNKQSTILYITRSEDKKAFFDYDLLRD